MSVKLVFLSVDIIKQRTKNIELKKYAVNRLEELGSFDYTLTTLTGLNKKTRDEVSRLGENPYLNQLLDFLETI